MQTICPISFEKVNEKAAQVNAALAIVLILAFFFTPYKWLILIPTIDFFIRGFLKPSYSYFSAFSRTILRISKIDPLMVNAGPKIFAAKIGFIFCCVIAGLYWFELYSISLVIGFVFIFFAALEAIFRFCIACKIYPLICKIKRADS